MDTQELQEDENKLSKRVTGARPADSMRDLGTKHEYKPGNAAKLATIDDSDLKKTRFRQRSRTPNTYNTIDPSRGRNNIVGYGSNRPSSVSRAQAQTSIQKTASHGESTLFTAASTGGRRLRSRKSSAVPGGQSRGQMFTVDSTVSKDRLTSYRSNVPGPGAYDYKSIFPSGPKFAIQRKTKWDSLLQTKIAQNVSPGPARYAPRKPVGGTHQTIAIKLKTDDPSHYRTVSELIGPGAYEVNHVRNLKSNPKATIGRSKRLFIQCKAASSAVGPQTHNSHKKMSDLRTISQERNAARCTIGNEPKTLEDRNPTPGPSAYVTSIRSIGDERSQKVPFAQQIRPISAKPGQITKIEQPGPQDYDSVNVNFYKRRGTVIPAGSFSNAGKQLETAETNKRAKSPGPNQYRPQSAVVLSKSPVATIGTCRRFQGQQQRILSAQSPGVGQYNIQRTIGNGPKYHIAGKHDNDQRVRSPGPSDYNTDPVKFLKKNPTATIGDAKLKSSIASRSISPGPNAYRPNKLNFSKRAASVKFNREKRAGLIKINRNTATPGPGDYMIPCKFLQRPRFMESKENKFRYV